MRLPNVGWAFLRPMDPETVHTITASAITAISTLAGAAIVAYFGYRVQKHTQQQPLSFPALEATHFKIGQVTRL